MIYMDSETKQKSYYLPVVLAEYFKIWCKPGRDYSPKVAGALLYFMTLPPDIRQKCEKLAYSDDIKTVIDQLTESSKNDDLISKMWNVPALPIQPEEHAILYSDLDIKRFIDILREYRPRLLERCLTINDENSFSHRSFSDSDTSKVEPKLGASMAASPSPEYKIKKGHSAITKHARDKER